MEKDRDPKLIALLFNECINEQNIPELKRYMAENYTFISTTGQIEKGKAANLKGWEEFFERYPDYLNIFTRVENRLGKAKEQIVFMLGYSICSEKELDGPAIWQAKVRNNLIFEWKIYDDTVENRKKLGLEN